MRIAASVLGLLGGFVGLLFNLSALLAEIKGVGDAGAYIVNIVALIAYVAGLVGGAWALRNPQHAKVLMLGGGIVSLVFLLTFGSVIVLVPFVLLVAGGILSWRSTEVASVAA